MKKYNIFAVGNALVDHEYLLNDAQLAETGLIKGSRNLASLEEQQQLLKAFADLNIKIRKKTGGGAAANSIFASSCLGASTFYACRVADDEAGTFYLQDLQENGVVVSEHSIQEDSVTGICVSCVTEDGERTMQTYLGTSNDLEVENIKVDLVADSDWLYFEGYLAMSPSMMVAGGGIDRLRETALANDVKIAVSFADPAVVKFAKDGVQKILGLHDQSADANNQGIDILFCNQEEAMIYTGADDLDAAIVELLKITKAVAVTTGAKGALIAQREAEGHSCFTVTTPKVAKVVDTTGAGDNFAGAFLAALIQGKSLEESAKLACHVASAVVAKFGARLQKPEYQDILEKIEHKII